MSHYTYTLQFTHMARESIESHLYAHRILTHLTCLLLSRNPGCQRINANPKSILGRWKHMKTMDHSWMPNMLKPHPTSQILPRVWTSETDFPGFPWISHFTTQALGHFSHPRPGPVLPQCVVRTLELSIPYTPGGGFRTCFLIFMPIPNFTNSFQIGLNPPPSYKYTNGNLRDGKNGILQFTVTFLGWLSDKLRWFSDQVAGFLRSLVSRQMIVKMVNIVMWIWSTTKRRLYSPSSKSLAI